MDGWKIDKFAVPPFKPWMLHCDPNRNGPWGVKDHRGINVAVGPNGAVFLNSREEAIQLVITDHKLRTL